MIRQKGMKSSTKNGDERIKLFTQQFALIIESHTTTLFKEPFPCPLLNPDAKLTCPITCSRPNSSCQPNNYFCVPGIHIRLDLVHNRYSSQQNQERLIKKQSNFGEVKQLTRCMFGHESHNLKNILGSQGMSKQVAQSVETVVV